MTADLEARTSDDPQALAALVLEQEAERQAEQESRHRGGLVLPDDLLPGVGGDHMPLREVMRSGGKATLVVMFGLGLVDNLDSAAFGILAPDIRDSLGIGSGLIGVIGALAGFTLFLAALPLGTLGDRTRRTAIAGVSTLLWAAAAALTGAAQSIWQMVAVRTATGIGKANEGPIQSSILADAYPPEGRGRVFALHKAASPVGILIGPVLAGGIAAVAGWRWAFAALAIPAVVLGIAAFLLPEPKRGRYEQLAALGSEMAQTTDEVPVSLGAAFTRLKKVRSFYYIMASLGAFGFAVTTVPIYLMLIAEERFGLSAGERGLVGTITATGAVAGAVLGGRYSDRLFRRRPELAMWLVGGALAVLGIGLGIQAYAPTVVVFVAVGIVSQGLLYAGLVPASPIVAAVVPYRLRSIGFAVVGLYLSLVGGLGGALLAAAIAEAYGEQIAVVTVAPISSLVAAGLMGYGSRFLRADIAAAAADIIEERDEQERVAAGGELPLLQVRNLDFSYGPVQVLFDVSLDVRQGEVLALLGTNGAGKSTLLRAISGLDPADRGVIRLAGRTVTLADPSTRVALGIVQVPGGKSVFPTLSVADNLIAGGITLLRDQEELEERVEHVLDLFPILRERLKQPAGTLSGGEQQMLGLATAMLLRPRLLLIDELSLGLAPVVVQQMLETVERLKAEGLTMVIVEQSVNVALAIADRAVFMEKGQVRFEGPAADLLERDDLVRAVFLGGEGG